MIKCERRIAWDSRRGPQWVQIYNEETENGALKMIKMLEEAHPGRVVCHGTRDGGETFDVFIEVII